MQHKKRVCESFCRPSCDLTVTLRRSAGVSDTVLFKRQTECVRTLILIHVLRLPLFLHGIGTSAGPWCNSGFNACKPLIHVAFLIPRASVQHLCPIISCSHEVGATLHNMVVRICSGATQRDSPAPPPPRCHHCQCNASPLGHEEIDDQGKRVEVVIDKQQSKSVSAPSSLYRSHATAGISAYSFRSSWCRHSSAGPQLCAHSARHTMLP
jgi:hypothetical protein